MSVKIRPYKGQAEVWHVDVIVRLSNGQLHRERRRMAVSKSTAKRWGHDRERHLLQFGPRNPRRRLQH